MSTVAEQVKQPGAAQPPVPTLMGIFTPKSAKFSIAVYDRPAKAGKRRPHGTATFTDGVLDTEFAVWENETLDESGAIQSSTFNVSLPRGFMARKYSEQAALNVKLWLDTIGDLYTDYVEAAMNDGAIRDRGVTRKVLLRKQQGK